MTEHVDVAIIGGGIAGLTAAYRLVSQAPSLRIALYEASDRLGGKIMTEHVDQPDGRFLVEAGPDAFLAQKPWARELIEELCLSGQLVPINSLDRPVAILKNGKPIDLPDGIPLIAPTRLAPFLRSPLLGWGGKARTMLEPVIPARTEDSDESLGSFVRRRLGSEALDWIAEPLAAGVYNADPDRLSMLATFPGFHDLERKHGSVIHGLRVREEAIGRVRAGVPLARGWDGSPCRRTGIPHRSKRVYRQLSYEARTELGWWIPGDDTESIAGGR